MIRWANGGRIHRRVPALDVILVVRGQARVRLVPAARRAMHDRPRLTARTATPRSAAFPGILVALLRRHGAHENKSVRDHVHVLRAPPDVHERVLVLRVGDLPKVTTIERQKRRKRPSLLRK